MRGRSSPLAITSISLAGLLAVASTATVVGQGDGDPLAPVMPELGSVDERGRAFLPGTAEHPFGLYFAGVPGEVVHGDLAGLLVGVRQNAPGDGVKVQAGAKGKPNPVGPWDLLGSRSVAGSPGVVMSGRGDVNGDCRVDEVDAGLVRTPGLDAYPHPDDPGSGGGSVLAARTSDYSADVNGDGAVNSLDVQIVEESFGLGCSDSPT
jgi:hypothetical protein